MATRQWKPVTEHSSLQRLILVVAVIVIVSVFRLGHKQQTQLDAVGYSRTAPGPKHVAVTIEVTDKGTMATSESTLINSTHITKALLNKALRINYKEGSTENTSLPCDGECQDFQKLIKSWPPSRVKGAIYLTFRMVESNLRRLRLCLEALDAFVLKKYHYPVVIFHETIRIPGVLDLRNITSSPLFFQLMYSEIPSSLDVDSIPRRVPGCPGDVNYRRMCRFQCKEVYEYPIME